MAWNQVWCTEGHVVDLVRSKNGPYEIGGRCRVSGCNATITFMTSVSRGSYHGIIKPVPINQGVIEEARKKRSEAHELHEEAVSLRRQLRDLEEKISKLQKDAGLMERYKVPNEDTPRLILDEEHPDYQDWRRKCNRKRKDLWPLLKPIEKERV